MSPPERDPRCSARAPSESTEANSPLTVRKLCITSSPLLPHFFITEICHSAADSRARGLGDAII
jgi:hypothetical protein